MLSITYATVDRRACHAEFEIDWIRGISQFVAIIALPAIALYLSMWLGIARRWVRLDSDGNVVYRQKILMTAVMISASLVTLSAVRAFFIVFWPAA